MHLSKKEYRLLHRLLAGWTAQKLLTPEQRQTLEESVEIKTFDWQRLARYSFWGALGCILVSVGAVVMDERLVALIKTIFNSPPLVKCLFFIALAVAFFWGGLALRSKRPERVFSHDALFFLGVASLAGAIGFLGQVLDTGSGHFSLLLLLAAVVYGLIGLSVSSKLVWLFSLLSLGSWFGAETGYLSGWGAYYLGMNYPLRFIGFGTALLLFSYLLTGQFQGFQRITRIMGLLYTFIALWIMSIFGNYGDIQTWYEVKQYELLHWSLLFGLASIAAIAVGLKSDDGVLRGFGLVFLFLNLYTRFFELFWDGLHKALFFGVLGLSLWLLGHYAESIWLVRSQKDKGVSS